jgi:hypothetical protein
MKWHTPRSGSGHGEVISDLLTRHSARSIGRRWRAWRDRGAGRELVRWIRYGVLLPLRSTPTPSPRKASRPKNSQERLGRTLLIQELVAKGVLEPCSTDDFAAPFWAEQKRDDQGLLRPGKYRFLNDLRHTNTFLIKKCCRFETLSALPSIARVGDVATVLDLEEFFYSIPLHPSHRRYCALITDDGDVLQFTCLPMGLACSPWFTTKIARFVMSLLRGRGIRVMWYVDDVAVLSGPTDIHRHTLFLRQLLVELGFTINPTKGFQEPKRLFPFLGLEIDLRRRRFRVPTHKAGRLRDACERTLLHARCHNGFVPRRALAGLAGLAESLRLAAPGLRLFTRSVLAAAAVGTTSKASWNGTARANRQVCSDIRAILASTTHTLWAPFEPRAPTCEMWSDASVVGYGATIVTPSLPTPLPPVAGFFGAPHVSGDITLLEMNAVARALEVWGGSIPGAVVRLHVDNFSVVTCLKQGGSRTPRIMAAYREVAALCRRHHLELQPEWIATLDNVAADALSRRRDPSEYRVSPELPQLAARAWPDLGPPSGWRDRFASCTAHQAGMRYDSRFPHPGASTWDTLSREWLPGSVNWLTPPLAMIGRCLEKLRADSATGVLLHPDWPAQPWAPDLRELTVASVPIGCIAEFVTPVPGTGDRPEALRNPKWVWRLSLLRSSVT